MATDVFIIYELLNGKNVIHQWWASGMILFLLVPYLVSHSTACSIMNDKRQHSIAIILATNDRWSAKCCTSCSLNWRKYGRLSFLNVLSFILMTPFSFIIFVFADVMFSISFFCGFILLLW
jgi:hypothetical protein